MARRPVILVVRWTDFDLHDRSSCWLAGTGFSSVFSACSVFHLPQLPVRGHFAVVVGVRDEHDFVHPVIPVDPVGMFPAHIHTADALSTRSVP